MTFDPNHRTPGKRHQGEAGGLAGHVLRLPAAVPTLPADTPIFTVPAGLVRILDRDLVAAGIARRVKWPGKWKIDKRDERGRTVDVHALRHTFGTLLSKGGVTPRTAQAAMRHSDDRPDDEHLHRSEALGRGRGDGSPAGAPAWGWSATGSRRRKCNGHRRFDPFAACTNACTNYRQTVHIGVNSGQGDRQQRGNRGSRGRRRKCLPGQGKSPLTTAVNGPFKRGRRDLNPRPSDPRI